MYHKQADEELSCDWQLLVHGESVGAAFADVYKMRFSNNCMHRQCGGGYRLLLAHIT